MFDLRKVVFLEAWRRGGRTFSTGVAGGQRASGAFTDAWAAAQSPRRGAAAREARVDALAGFAAGRQPSTLTGARLSSDFSRARAYRSGGLGAMPSSSAGWAARAKAHSRAIPMPETRLLCQTEGAG